MKWTKLDRYDYTLSPGVIRISLSGINDPDLVDIMSEVNMTEGRIYVEGQRFKYLDDYQIFDRGPNAYLELYVTQW